jgi:hypothetical protein
MGGMSIGMAQVHSHGHSMHKPSCKGIPLPSLPLPPPPHHGDDDEDESGSSGNMVQWCDKWQKMGRMTSPSPNCDCVARALPPFLHLP